MYKTNSRVSFAALPYAHMADEDFDLDLEEDRNQKRFKDLSQKVKDTATERDEANAAREEAQRLAAEAAKERDFYAEYSDVAVQYPNAKEYKDDIKSKVLAGYTVEDATIAVLAKNGKLTTTYEVPPAPEISNPAGGSAANSNVGGRSTQNMSMADMRAALMEAEQRGDFG